MALKNITLDENHIRLISNLNFESFVFDGDSRNGQYAWGIDQYAPWGGDYTIEDVARILGYWDQYIEGTEENPLGRRYPEEIENILLKYYHDIVDNMALILDLVVSFSGQGGLKVGTYKCNPRLRNWMFIEKTEEKTVDKND